MAPPVSRLGELFATQGTAIVAEGYLFELERRGYLSAGTFIPEVVLQHPDVVRHLHENFVHAGSDVCLALTYGADRTRLRCIDREEDVKAMNQSALSIAKDVARKTDTIFAASLCGTAMSIPIEQSALQEAKNTITQQLECMKGWDLDMVVCETIPSLQEALICVKCAKEMLPSTDLVVTLCPGADDKTSDGVPLADACLQLEMAGANVVGLNCSRGPKTMLPLMHSIVSACSVPVACLPVCYKTSPMHVTMQMLQNKSGASAFPLDLDAHQLSRSDVSKFALRASRAGVRYIGLCCGNAPHFTRTIAESLGRSPGASKYSPDLIPMYNPPAHTMAPSNANASRH